jgi:hypothetical protein
MDDLILAAEQRTKSPPAPSRLKSRILSTLIGLEQEQGPLRVLSESKAEGEPLCVFEHAVALLPSKNLQSRYPCNICHARILAENFENPPTYWPGCPYVAFRKAR